MTYKTHLLGGVAAVVALFPIVVQGAGVNTGLLSAAGVVCVSAGMVGGLLPDIDHKNSFIGKKFRITSSIVSNTCGHRGITHAPLITTILLAAALFFLKTPSIYWYAAIYGCFGGIYSHILLDSFTKGGVPLFYPFSKKKFSIGLLITGGKAEKIFRLVLGVGTFILTAKII